MGERMEFVGSCWPLIALPLPPSTSYSVPYCTDVGQLDDYIPGTLVSQYILSTSVIGYPTFLFAFPILRLPTLPSRSSSTPVCQPRISISICTNRPATFSLQVHNFRLSLLIFRLDSLSFASFSFSIYIYVRAFFLRVDIYTHRYQTSKQTSVLLFNPSFCHFARASSVRAKEELQR